MVKTSLGKLSSITMGQSPDSLTVNENEVGLPFLQGCAEFGSRFPNPKFYCHPPLRVATSGSILLSVRAPVGATNSANQDFCIGRGLAALKAISGISDPNFLFYAINSDLSFLHRRSQGSTFLAISSKDVADFPIPDLDIRLQNRIGYFLSTVETLIVQTQALISKYQQIKAGLMQDLFTRGVTPDGKLRPSREEAPGLYKESPVGWIPKEWSCIKLGNLAEIVSGITLGSKSDIFGDTLVHYLRVANVQDGFFDLSDVKNIFVTKNQLDKLALQRGDVLMNEGGDFDKLGRGSVWLEQITPCIHQNHVFRVRPKSTDLGSYFLAFWSQSDVGKKYFVLNSKQSTNLASINSTQLHRFPVALPQESEQGRIESRILSINSFIDQLKADSISLSHLRSGLMQDLLTGRVQVDISLASLTATAVV